MLPNCDSCKFCDDVESVRRNRQFDIIYCDRCKKTFERRMQPWNCPYSPACNKNNLLQPNSCDECPYSVNDMCNLTHKDMQVNTLSLSKVCPLRSKEWKK